jgi:hypothetical protein
MSNGVETEWQLRARVYLMQPQANMKEKVAAFFELRENGASQEDLIIAQAAINEAINYQVEQLELWEIWAAGFLAESEVKPAWMR